MQVVVRQAVLLFGERYSVGLRIFPQVIAVVQIGITRSSVVMLYRRRVRNLLKIEPAVEEKQEKPEKKSKKSEG